MDIRFHLNEGPDHAVRQKCSANPCPHYKLHQQDKLSKPIGAFHIHHCAKLPMVVLPKSNHAAQTSTTTQIVREQCTDEILLPSARHLEERKESNEKFQVPLNSGNKSNFGVIGVPLAWATD